jgi:uncharacterized protein (TIGR02611 family)
MSSTAGEPRREEPKLVRRLRERQAEHKQRGRIYRAAFVVAGVTVLLAGVAMLALPGPAFVVIPIGLAILSLEFAWAGALLEKALDRAEAAKETAKETSTAQRIVVTIACVLAAAAFAWWAIFYDVPVLPV